MERWSLDFGPVEDLILNKKFVNVGPEFAAMRSNDPSEFWPTATTGMIS